MGTERREEEEGEKNGGKRKGEGEVRCTLIRGAGMMPCTDEGPERETSVRATSPMRPTVPPP